MICVQPRILPGELTMISGSMTLCRYYAKYCIWVVLLLGGICTGFGADLKVLPGHVPKVLSSLVPTGRLASTNELWLAIGLPLRDQTGLANFVAQVSDPASPNFHHYL